MLESFSRVNDVIHCINTIAHAVWGAVEAQLQGGNTAAGATAAATAELGAQYLAEKLYGKTNPNDLTEAQKQTVSELSQTVAGLAAGLTAGASGADSATMSKEANAGVGIGKNAVENNGLLDSQVLDLFRDLENAEKEGKSLEEIFTKAKALSDKQYKELEDSCVNSAICRYGTEKMLEDSNQKYLTEFYFFLFFKWL